MSANGRDKPRHRDGNDHAQGLYALELRSSKSIRNILSQNDFNPEEEDQIRREDLGSSVGESLTVRFDAAKEYDLTASSNFTAVALGFIPYAESYSTFLNGSTIAYHSNDVTAIDVKDSCEGDLLAQVAAASFLYWSLRATNAMPMASSMASQDCISKLPNELLLLILEKFANKEDLK
ncbi:hypothetical protein DBV05_g87 [Lasiodiplodia theobromae]|uniref:Uncharacterized protein n=1 Tax=Lasiodiplodia theobromae TaxID=45133 RepID=A0A5N5DSR1_9PEZI|nr:hypothetical protein DBV05_g87 [Lasiodiplodia theobromae]